MDTGFGILGATGWTRLKPTDYNWDRFGGGVVDTEHFEEIHKVTTLFSHQAVEETLARLAAEIRRDYQGKTLLLIGILKGSFVFMADLMRLLDLPLEVEFVKLSSYGQKRKESSGRINLVQGLSTSIKGRDVLVIEDIVDTGLTIVFLLDYLQKRRPASLKLCALLSKPSRRQVDVTIDYLGFTVLDRFIVGYGLDWDERFRNLPDICVLEEEDQVELRSG